MIAIKFSARFFYQQIQIRETGVIYVLENVRKENEFHLL